MSTEYTISSPNPLTRLRDEEYYTYEPLIADDDPLFSEDQLTPGAVARTTIPFKLPVSANGLKLLLDVNDALFGGVTLIIVNM